MKEGEKGYRGKKESKIEREMTEHMEKEAK